MARWDWYATTVKGHRLEEVSAAVLMAFDLADLAPGRPKYGYEQAAEVRRGDRVLAQLWWGGNPGIHVVGTGENAPAVAGAVKAFRHGPSRVDACEDWIEEGLFDRLAAPLIRYAEGHRIAINQQGDWVRGQGRTLYLGSKASAVRLVLYEKGYEAGGDLNWVRLEARVRASGLVRELLVSQWVPRQAFGASQWLCEALEAIGWDHLQQQSVTKPWRPSDVERARFHMLRQYGPTLQAWADELGSWQALAACLADVLSRPLIPTATLQTEQAQPTGKALHAVERT